MNDSLEQKMEQKPLNLGRLLVYFVAFTIAGSALAYIYLGAIDMIPYIQANFFIAIGYGAALYFIIAWLKKWLKITNDKGASIFTVLGIIFINYLKWQTFFAVWYTRGAGFDISYFNVHYVLDGLEWIILYPFEHGLNPVVVFFSDLAAFNYYGTWYLFDRPLRGVVLGVIWVAQFAILFGPSLMSAWEPVGIMLNGKWSRPRYQLYNFEPFADEQIERLADFLDTKVILEQPLAGKNSTLATDKYGVTYAFTGKEIIGKVSLVAQLYADDTPTDYIVISTGAVSAKRAISGMFGKPTRPIQLGEEKIAELMDELMKLHDEATDEDDVDIDNDPVNDENALEPEDANA